MVEVSSFILTAVNPFVEIFCYPLCKPLMVTLSTLCQLCVITEKLERNVYSMTIEVAHARLTW